MSNTFLTLDLIAREGLARLNEKLMIRNLIHTDYKNDFQKRGDTIQVEVPPTYTAQEFTTTISAQAINESSISIKLDKIVDVSVEFSSKERALNIRDYGNQFLQPAIDAIAKKVETDLLTNFYKDVYNYAGTSGTTPDGMDDLASVRKALSMNLAPDENRSALWDYDAVSKFIQLSNLANVEKAGTNTALRNAYIGQVYGLMNYEHGLIATHVAGTFTAVASPKVKGEHLAGVTTITLDGGSGTETIKQGDIFAIGTQKFVATADATASGGEVGIVVSPAVASTIANDADVVFPDKTNGGHVANLGFHKNAFAFVQRPLEKPYGGVDSYVAVAEGLSLRAVAGYNQSTKKETLSLDLLYGYKTLRPELAIRTLG